MTIASATSRISYVGDGSTTAFAVPFLFQSNADITVMLQSSTGVQTTLILGTGYSLSGAGVSSGGTCVFTVAPTALTGAVITIFRDPPVTQTTSYNNNDPFPAKSHENALDKVTMLEQRTRDMVTRSIRLPDSDPALSTQLPTLALRANKLLGFDGSGLPVAVLGPSFVGSTNVGVAEVSTKSVAAVTTFPGTIIVLRTSGSTTPGDGQEATYIHGTGTGSFTDGGGVSWVPVPAAAILNVRFYGAKGDNVTDDSGAIQAALNAAAALGTPAAVYLPPGQYRCNTGLTMGGTNTANAQILLFGDGPAACTIVAGASMVELLRIGPAAGSTARLNRPEVNGIRFLGGSFCSVAVVHFYNCIYARFEDLRIEGGSATGIQGDGNPNTSGNSGDPFTQGCFISKVSALNCGGYGHYYRGVKGSIFSDLESDGCTGHSFYWDMEQQAGGANEITENVITNCIAKNGGNAGFALSGIAKHNFSNIEAYICAGAAVLFQPTISGANAASFFNVISGLIARNCNGGVIVTVDGSGVNGITVNGVNVVGGAGTGIYMKGWIRFTLSNVVITGFQGNNILVDDDPTPPSGGSSSSGSGAISNIVLIGASQTSTQAGIMIAGHSAQIRISNVISNQAGGSSGYEIVANSATTSDIEISDMTLVPNTAAHELSIGGSSGVVFHGANRTNVTGTAALWMPRGTPSSTAFAGQLYEDSGNSNKLSWMDSAGTKHVINTTP